MLEIAWLHIDVLSLTHPAYQNMCVRVRRIVVIGRHPLERQPEIPCHLPHELLNKACAVKLRVLRKVRKTHIEREAVMILLHLLREPVGVCRAWPIERRLGLLPPFAVLQIPRLDAACGRPRRIHFDHHGLTLGCQRFGDRATRAELLERSREAGALRPAAVAMAPAEMDSEVSRGACHPVTSNGPRAGGADCRRGGARSCHRAVPRAPWQA